ncbi:hypothetical protein PR001_g9278 [Phytophthora rubi]|uniref:Uncharacterized protein n=1 Tax=Phytophthora rubi TaxID=129364 RepID=A0A6A3N1Q8_9STRA|nr:hypothetical protein PR002_g9505 [Phytophthora rubi]KAE9035490.1 hypothetical protein PR001_g9278 [Phytophthora rubi]
MQFARGLTSPTILLSVWTLVEMGGEEGPQRGPNCPQAQTQCPQGCDTAMSQSGRSKSRRSNSGCRSF